MWLEPCPWSLKLWAHRVGRTPATSSPYSQPLVLRPVPHGPSHSTGQSWEGLRGRFSPRHHNDHSLRPSTPSRKILRATLQGRSYRCTILQMRKPRREKGYLLHDHRSAVKAQTWVSPWRAPCRPGAGKAPQGARSPGLEDPPKKEKKSGGTAQAMQTVPAWERGFGDRAPRGAPPAPLPEQLPLTSAFP